MAVSSQLTGDTQIVANSSAYAALKSDGAVVKWGIGNRDADPSAVSSQGTSVVDFTDRLNNDDFTKAQPCLCLISPADSGRSNSDGVMINHGFLIGSLQ